MKTDGKQRKDLQARLRGAYAGELAADAGTLAAFATDASIYEMTPLAVAYPRTEEEIRSLLAFCRETRTPLLPRGSGTSLAGQTVTTGVVVDFSRWFNKILWLDEELGLACVQPGVVRDQLNAEAAACGRWFAPDPATTSRATVGGMIANNASGSRSIRYGRTIDHLESVRVMLADGSIATFENLAPDDYDAACAGDGAEARILRGLRLLVTENHAEIAARFPKVMRRVGGYCLDEFPLETSASLEQRADWNPAKLLCGSEGTLAIVLDAVVRLAPKPPFTALAVVHFESLRAAIAAVPALLRHAPACVEVLDQQLLRLSRDNPMTRRNCNFLQGDPGAVQVLEFTGDSQAEATAHAERLATGGIGYACSVLSDDAAQQDVWKVRKNGLGLMLGVQGRAKPIAFIEDAAVPVEHLPDYIDGVVAACRSRDVDAILYAHASVGVIHVRPILDLRTPQGIADMQAIARDTFNLVRKYGGSWSGEHGDGIVRGSWNQEFFGDQLYAAFRELKALFDPLGILNPGKIVDTPAMTENLRYGTDYAGMAPAGEFRYREPEGFESGVDACTGVGACRSLRAGTMCPSFRASRDEVHSTRGRANVLRMALAGRIPGEDLTGPAVAEALDLCLSCKACKTECPSNVDMARLKAETLQLRHDKLGAPISERLAAAAPTLIAAASGKFAPIVNAAARAPWFRKAALAPFGVDPNRKLPTVSAKPFRAEATADPATLDVVLFVDCWLENCEPELGHAAMALFEKLGFRAAAIRPGCCQRTRISHGFLRDAARDGHATLSALDPFLRANVPIVTLEPSCGSALTDDLPDLVADVQLGQRAAAGILPIETFLAKQIAAGKMTPLSLREPILLQPHCHQRALHGQADLTAIFAPGSVEILQAGCCGMAGSFGHETRHSALSMAVFHDRLGSILATKPETAVAANGFSCRCQIQELANRPAPHWLTYLSQ